MWYDVTGQNLPGDFVGYQSVFLDTGREPAYGVAVLLLSEYHCRHQVALEEYDMRRQCSEYSQLL